MVNRIYSAELQLNEANSSDTEAPFLDLNLSISNGTVSTKIYDKRDDFDLILLISRFLMEASLDMHHMAFIYLSLFVPLERLLT